MNGTVAPERDLVINVEGQAGRLPSQFSPYVIGNEWMRRQGEGGVLARFPQAARVVRKAGIFSDEDFFSFLACRFFSLPHMGLRDFWERTREYGAELAGLSSRQRWPSQPALSRFLDRATREQTSALQDWLLLQEARDADFWQDPRVMHRDARGELLHILDFDGKVSAFRERALPEDDDQPAAIRRARERGAAPGRLGRKRGESQWTRVFLLHEGAAWWLGTYTMGGNGDTRHWVHWLVERALHFCQTIGVAPQNVVLRGDGQWGHVGEICSYQKAELQYLVRLTRNEMLEVPGVLDALLRREWEYVRSSTAGVDRFALDLGPQTFRGLGPDKEMTEVKTRVVVSRFETDRKRGAGHFENGAQYELYACSMAPQSWPAADVVRGYYGRAGAECRLLQEDHEMDLSRVLSENPAGQDWANGIGMSVWNMMTRIAHEIGAPVGTVPPLEARIPGPSMVFCTEPDTDPGDRQDVDAENPEHQRDSCSIPASTPFAAPLPAQQPLDVDGETESDLKVTTPAETPAAAPLQGKGISQTSTPGTRHPVRRGFWYFLALETRLAIIALFARIQVETGIFTRRKVTFHLDTGTYSCPMGHELAPAGVDPQLHGTAIRFRVFPSNACRTCSRHAECSRSKRPGRTEVSVQLPNASYEEFCALLLQENAYAVAGPSTPWPPLPPATPELPDDRPALPPGAKRWRRDGFDLTLLSPDRLDSPYTPCPSSFFPANLRRRYRQWTFPIQVTVDLPPHQPPATAFPNVKAVIRAREHRRLSWPLRLARNALSTCGPVRVTLHGVGPLAPLLVPTGLPAP